jgi:hypothetical protein
MSTSKKSNNLVGLLSSLTVGAFSYGVASLGAGSSILPLFVASFSSAIGGMAVNKASNYLNNLDKERISRFLVKNSFDEQNSALFDILKESIIEAFDEATRMLELQLNSDEEKLIFRRTVLKVKVLIEEEYEAFISRPETKAEVDLIANKKTNDYVDELFSQLVIESELLHNTNFNITLRSLFRDLLNDEFQSCFFKRLLYPNNEEAFNSYNLILSKSTVELLELILNDQKKITDKLDAIDVSRSSTHLTSEEINLIVSKLNNQSTSIELKGKFKNALNSVISNLETDIRRIEIELVKAHNEIRNEIKGSRAENHKWFIRTNKNIATIVKLVLGLFIALSVFAIMYLSFSKTGIPFTVTIKVHGLKGVNDVVLGGHGEVQLVLKGHEISSKINESGLAIFHNIPFEYKNLNVPIALINVGDESYQLLNVNNTVQLKPDSVIFLKIKLIGIDTVKGSVFDNETSHPIKGAIVTVAQISDTTDNNGNYCIPIPIQKQAKRLDIKAIKLGYEDFQKNQISILSEPYHNIYLNPK